MWPKALENLREFWRHRNGDRVSALSLSLIVVDLHTSRHIIGGCCDGSTMETRLAVKPRLFAYFSHAEYLVLVVYTEVETYIVGVGVRKHPRNPTWPQPVVASPQGVGKLYTCCTHVKYGCTTSCWRRQSGGGRRNVYQGTQL